MQILGFEPVVITLVVCVIGVSYQIITGMSGKSLKEFNPTLALTTFMLGVITSIGLVAPVIDAVPNDSDPLVQLTVVAGQVLLVMGMDSAVRKGQKIAQKVQEKKFQNSTDELEPIDDINDLPPGKDTGVTSN